MGLRVKRKAKIDRLDMRLLAAIAARGRQTMTELSKSVGLSVNPCAARLERMESDQYIRGYHADVDVESQRQGAAMPEVPPKEALQSQTFLRLFQLQ